MRINPSQSKQWKYVARYKDARGQQIKIQFGKRQEANYLDHRDTARKRRYQETALLDENFGRNPYSRSTLEYWLLWNQPSLEASLSDYRTRYSFD